MQNQQEVKEEECRRQEDARRNFEHKRCKTKKEKWRRWG